MGKVLRELLQEGLQRTDWTFVLFGDEPRAPMHAPEHPRIIRKIWEVKGDRFRAWEQFALPWHARRFRCDILHCPGTWCPHWQPVPTIVTVHDTLPWSEMRQTAYLRSVLPAAYKRCRKLLTPSESSMHDIEARWPALRHSISVVRWGINSAYLANTIPEPSPTLVDQGVRSPYLLYLGGEIPRKRLDWALRVWSIVAEERDLRLVVVGLDAPGNPRWMSQVPVRLHNRLVGLPFVEEADVPGLYSAAEAVLYPTLYEGFGFPALESQAVGTPVLMSAVGSLRELAGPGAIILPPEDVESWVDAIRNAAAHKHSARPAAREWARQFTWARTWGELQNIYTSRS